MKFDLKDQRHLQAAEGWLGLGDHLEANEELENISPEMRAHPAVLALRYEVYAAAKKWDRAVEVAEALTRLLPDRAAFWICLAYSLRRKTNGNVSLAKEILPQFSTP